MHSGIDGGAVVEPLNDLLGVLSTIVDVDGTVKVSGYSLIVCVCCDGQILRQRACGV
jgi:hypothetical protein